MINERNTYAKPMTQPPAKLSPVQRKRLDAATRIMSAPPETIDYLHTVQCQCGLPYRNPGENVREWDRKQGVALSASRWDQPSTRERGNTSS